MDWPDFLIDLATLELLSMKSSMGRALKEKDCWMRAGSGPRARARFRCASWACPVYGCSPCTIQSQYSPPCGRHEDPGNARAGPTSWR